MLILSVISQAQSGNAGGWLSLLKSIIIEVRNRISKQPTMVILLNQMEPKFATYR